MKREIKEVLSKFYSYQQLNDYEIKKLIDYIFYLEELLEEE